MDFLIRPMDLDDLVTIEVIRGMTWNDRPPIDQDSLTLTGDIHETLVGITENPEEHLGGR